MIYYTGVGSRETPSGVLTKMEVYGIVFAKLGYTLRSGGAAGADTAFEKGAVRVNGNKDIFLPWKGFNENYESPYYNVSQTAMNIAEEIYGDRWSRLTKAGRLLMSRNIYQILGDTLDTPSRFLICWTPDGATSITSRSRSTGGTGQAIACADLHNIPVFNLKNQLDEDMLLDFVGEL